MKLYNCDVCAQLIYFENTLCLHCNSELGYLPVIDNMSSLENVDGSLWRALAPRAQGHHYRKCQNYIIQKTCNWMIPAEDHNSFCLSCRLNEIIPDLSMAENREYWSRLEIAKRRLVYSLLRLGLPVRNKAEDPQKGLSFYFLAETKGPQIRETKKVITGHEQGKITINIAEANDAVREKMRLNMNERYRTLLGHFRHEIGHYYWFLIVENDHRMLSDFRTLFGDETENYTSALRRHYANGPHSDWQKYFVSAYASSHPWEDWAESWAHYLHMFDTLETGQAWGLNIKSNKVSTENTMNLEHYPQTFEEMRDQWIHLSSALNSLNRSMGMKDVYPFIWSESVIEKLRFIQNVIISYKEGASL